jgi:Uma2 family endonuclease
VDRGRRDPGFYGIHLLAKLATGWLFLPGCTVAALAKAWTGVVADPEVCGDPSSCEAGYGWLLLPGCTVAALAKAWTGVVADPGVCGDPSSCEAGYGWLLLPGCAVAALAKAWTGVVADPEVCGDPSSCEAGYGWLLLPGYTVAALAKAWTGVVADPGAFAGIHLLAKLATGDDDGGKSCVGWFFSRKGSNRPGVSSWRGFSLVVPFGLSGLKNRPVSVHGKNVGIPDKQTQLSIEEYLACEKASEVRHEYIGGAVYAMSGGSEAHNLLCGNLYAALRHHLRGKPCKAFMADMKLRLSIAEDDIFYYPDVFVTCEPADREKYYKTRPILIVEVLSPSTERLDRREKFLSYCALPSLQEYVLVDQERMHVTCFQRESDWKPQHLTERTVRLHLPSIGFEMTLADIYEDVPDMRSA